MAEDRAKLDNIPWFARGVPWFARGIAMGDVVRTETDADGAIWAREPLERSENYTIRVVPSDGGKDGPQAVLDLFAPLEADGEGLEQFGPGDAQCPFHREPLRGAGPTGTGTDQRPMELRGGLYYRGLAGYRFPRNPLMS
ncbi:hypothetical protein Aph01nite_58600 [Acrocarpospora phusangensis]|uniref:Uncharacterized protein n=1 Tax=Acrocarpospora phusangensis TaxID=1070424 RepID=A0A919QJM6_9ACTN|nr:hypothetical protein Aph01nite_58600 [Acrocarpospora phusangensis]